MSVRSDGVVRQDVHQQAWAGALMLVILIALTSVAVRIATRSKHG